MWVHLPSVLVFAAAANMDSLLVGLSYGIRKREIGWWPNILVGCITSAGTVLAMLLGRGILPFLPFGMANASGGAIIAAVGLIGFAHCLLVERPEEDTPHSLDTREALLLGAALAVNNAALGLGAGVTGMRVLPTVLFSLLTSLLFLRGGNHIGCQKLSGWLGRWAELVSCVLMVCLGLYEVVV